MIGKRILGLVLMFAGAFAAEVGANGAKTVLVILGLLVLLVGLIILTKKRTAH